MSSTATRTLWSLGPTRRNRLLPPYHARIRHLHKPVICMKPRNPQEQTSMSETLTDLTIIAKLGPDLVWHVHCPQWQYHGEDKNLTRIVALLLADIETHVDFQEIGKPYISTGKTNKYSCKQIPDDNTKTPRVHLWQAPC